MAGMVRRRPPAVEPSTRPLVGATMFGVTTPCVTRARERLEARGYEVLVFHATGTGGQAMEALVDGGFLAGVLDITTTELCRRPRRRRALRRARTGSRRPAARASRRSSRSARSTWSTSAPRDTVPERFADRNLYVHNPTVTLMRTTPEEMRRARPADRAQAERRRPGRRRCSCRCAACRRSTPPGQPFHDPEADAALFAALRDGLDRQRRGASRSTPTSTTRRSPTRWPTACTSSSGKRRDDAATRRSRGCARRSSRAAPIIGAGAGTGLSAKCAEAGGADLIIIYNSGRYRMAGRGSLAGLLPYGDANAIVMDMAARGAAGRARHAGAGRRVRHRPVPAHAACSCASSSALGFAGVQNFPTVGLIDGDVPRRPRGDRAWATALEVEMIRQARELGPAHRAVRLRPRTRRGAMAEAGADVLVAAHGADHQGHDRRADRRMTLDERVERVQAMRDAAAAVNPDVIVLCHGGPIAEPEDAAVRARRARRASSASSAPRAWSGCRPRSR